MEKPNGLLKLLRELREREGRDNALIHYLEAEQMLSTLPVEIQKHIPQWVRQGTLEGSEMQLDPILDAFQSIFAEIRRGAALDYARNAGLGDFDNTPCPSSERLKLVARMLCIESSRCLSRGEVAAAMEDFLAALTMGRDLTAPVSPLTAAHLCGLDIERGVLDSSDHMLSSGLLDRPTLNRVAARLAVIEATTTPMVETMEAETAQFLKIFFDWLAAQSEHADDLARQLGQPKDDFFCPTPTDRGAGPNVLGGHFRLPADAYPATRPRRLPASTG